MTLMYNGYYKNKTNMTESDLNIQVLVYGVFICGQ